MKYLVIRIEQYASDEAYPYLQQQQAILEQVVEQVLEDFPFQKGEGKLFTSRPNCGCEYVCINLRGEAPSPKQMEYLQEVRPRAYKLNDSDGGVVAYEIIDTHLMEMRKAEEYYYWSHDMSKEIVVK